MDYEKCELYPHCTFVQCECHQNMLMKQHVKNKFKDNESKGPILRFEVINGKPTPIYKDKEDDNSTSSTDK